jgi:5-methylcytosine-specific restriction endonuclease McrA
MCEREKDVSHFYRYKLSQDGYQRYCKVCDRLYKQSKKGKQSKRKQERSASGRLSKKKYHLSEKGAKTRIRYVQSKKGKLARNLANRIRRTRKTQVGGFHTAAEWYELCEFYEFKCLRCGKQYPFDNLTLDHVKPVSKGGSSFIWNTQPLCKSCNSIKGDKEIDYRKSLPDWIKRDGPVWQQDTLF